MRSSTVLVIGAKSNNKLLDGLFNAGLVPVLRTTMQYALDTVRHEKFAGIVLDRDYAEVDALELVLNIRDIDGEIPVLVIGQADDPNDDLALAQLDHTVVLKQLRGIKPIIQHLKNLSPSYKRRA